MISFYSTGFAFSKKHLTKETTDAKLIKIANIKPMEIVLENTDYVNELGKIAGAEEIMNINNILIGMSGSVGIAGVVRERNNAYINQRILRIQIKDIIDPEYLSFIINSKVGKLQIEKYGTGGVQVNVSPKDILNIKIPRLGEIESQISNLIKRSFGLKKQSQQLLEEAKQRVEQLIKEEAAKKGINIKEEIL